MKALNIEGRDDEDDLELSDEVVGEIERSMGKPKEFFVSHEDVEVEFLGE